MYCTNGKPGEITETETIKHLTSIHGANIDNWPPEILDEIKGKAKARQIAASLCPSFDDLTVRKRMFARISGLPQ